MPSEELTRDLVRTAAALHRSLQRAESHDRNEKHGNPDPIEEVQKTAIDISAAHDVLSDHMFSFDQALMEEN